MGSEFSVEFSYNEIEEEFKNLIEANKIIHNKLKDFLGTFTCEEQVQIIVAYRRGGTQQVLEILEEGSLSVHSQF